MDLYTKVSNELSERLTKRYSTSFSLSIRLFSSELRPHIYAIYGLVRIADEIVDTYRGPNTADLLDELEKDVLRALRIGYSANPIVHAFASTARQFGITAKLVTPFFKSMRMDLAPPTFTQKLYEDYIHGSAEVIGLMCLRVFTNQNETVYAKLLPGALRLGAAYQKVNFLRDIAADADERGRWYFPYGSRETFDEKLKTRIIRDIEKDMRAAQTAINRLPDSARRAVQLSTRYYGRLLEKLRHTPAPQLLRTRIRINNGLKLLLLLRSLRG